MSAHPSWRGDRHLRVGIEIRARSASVTSVTLVEEPAVQSHMLTGPMLARVSVGGTPLLSQSFEDPRVVIGSASREHPMHSVHVQDSGVVYVDVPLQEGQPLDAVGIDVADLSRVQKGPLSADDALAVMSDPPSQARRVVSLTEADLRVHPDWLEVGPRVGLPAEQVSGFEIYRDRALKWRWRLRRPDGEIVADSGRGYVSLEECETDLRWVRRLAPDAPVRSLDDEA